MEEGPGEAQGVVSGPGVSEAQGGVVPVTWTSLREDGPGVSPDTPPFPRDDDDKLTQNPQCSKTDTLNTNGPP